MIRYVIGAAVMIGGFAIALSIPASACACESSGAWFVDVRVPTEEGPAPTKIGSGKLVRMMSLMPDAVQLDALDSATGALELPRFVINLPYQTLSKQRTNWSGTSF
jgi:hypothetical protein